MKERKSNIELCRIICMLLIIAHHCVVHGGAINIDTCINKYIALFLLPGGKICFVTFLAISTWFLTDQSFKAERFFKMWLQVLFYSVIFTGISMCFDVTITTKNWISVLFPIIGYTHGFAATYLAFYILIPFLSIVADKITCKQLQWLIMLLIHFQIISKVIGAVGGYNSPICSELLLFILCYYTTIYIKKNPIKIIYRQKILFLIVLCSWFSAFLIYYMATIRFAGNEVVSFLTNLCSDESSIIYLIGGYALLFLFNNIKISPCKIINNIAKCVLGVLLLHDHPFFRNVLWNKIFHTQGWYYSSYFAIKVLLCTIIIFTWGVIIDYIRQKFTEPFLHLSLLKKLITAFEHLQF